ncbi:arrestin domain-containing 3-like protein [Labeo rohita]|uniref:Arrestin domain-containing 3-like protein n=1 Tax=Labeo rohita TaxID=84645 RepID=A0A498MN54_LABRO|nr:arrestin domain-containing 3-like protein [Labeo rohita]
MPARMDCGVGLLAGYDFFKALAPQQVITGGDEKLCVIKTDLGWSIKGGTPLRVSSMDVMGLCDLMRTRGAVLYLRVFLADVETKMSRSIKELSVHYDPINESHTFTSGDIVEGRVVLEVTKEIKVDSFFVKLTGDAHVSWTEGEDEDKRTYKDHERYFKLKQYFIQESSKRGQSEKYTTLVNGETCETISVFVDIDNSSSRDVKLKYSLKQQQTFIAGSSTNGGYKDIVKETRDRIPSGEKSQFTVDLTLPRDLTVTIENCRIIKVQYELKVLYYLLSY